MSIFDRGIRGNVQNPFQSLGDASQVPYTNPRMPQPFQGNVQLGLDYVLDMLSPNYKGTVATKAQLPTTATKNDYYIVSDDGDGKSAGYVYTVLEGNSQWVKRYDVDYSAEGVLAEAINRTQYMYVSKYGFTDKDSTGNNPITGTYAGQRVFGGDQTGQNLTFTANAFDLTGNVQFDNTILPTLFNTMDVGAAAMKWRAGYFKSSLVVDTTTIMPGNIADSSGAFSFNALNLSTTGTLSSGALTVGSTLILSSGLIADNSGAISFQANNLSTSGTFSAGVITGAPNSKLADITFTNGTLNTASSGFNFSAKPFTNVGAITSSGTVTGSKVVATEVDAGSVVVKGQLVQTSADNQTLTLQGGTGSSSSSMTLASPVSVSQTLNVTGAAALSSTLSVSGNTTLSGTLNVTTSPITLNSNLQLANTGTTATITSGGVLNLSSTALNLSASPLPVTDNTLALGSTTKRYTNAYLSGGISDGTNTMSMASLLSLRDINTNVSNGMSLFYNGTEWLPAAPNTNIDHRTLTNLTTGDAGHTQFALLAGRTGGQLLSGGTASGDNLTLDSTSNATKGLVLTSSTLAPTTASAVDVGTTVKPFRNLYSSGLFYGLRFDQYSGSTNYPTNATANIGRVIWDTSANQLLVDNGTSWSKVGNQKFLQDISFDGNTASQTITVSASISDARTGVWQLADNTNSFQRIQANLTMTQTAVTITSSPPLPSGTYRLIGFN